MKRMLAALALATAWALLGLLRQRGDLRRQVATLAHDVEALNDRICSSQWRPDELTVAIRFEQPE